MQVYKTTASIDSTQAYKTIAMIDATQACKTIDMIDATQACKITASIDATQENKYYCELLDKLELATIAAKNILFLFTQFRKNVDSYRCWGKNKNYRSIYLRNKYLQP